MKNASPSFLVAFLVLITSVSVAENFSHATETGDDSASSGSSDRLQSSSAEKTSPSVTDTPRRNFEAFVLAAQKGGSELGEQEGKVEASIAREAFARSFARPSGNLNLFVGPVPGARGNAVNGETNFSSWSVFTGVKAEVVQPLYAFGSLQAGRDAAEAGTRAEKHLLEKSRLTLRQEVAEFYYGFQLAFEFTELGSDLVSKLEEALQKGEKLKSSGRRGAPTATDLDKLKVFLAEARIRTLEAEKGMKLAKAAMSWKIGEYGRSEPRWDRANLSLREFQPQSLESYQTLARQKRPEYLALNEDVAAKTSLLKVEQGQMYPAFFVAASGTYIVSPNREKQQSPYAYDALNDLSGGLVLGMRWNLGLFERHSKVAMARAELMQAEARRRHFQAGIMADVERSYRDLVHAQASAKLRIEATRAARRVFQDKFVAFGLGSGSAKDLLEALGNFAASEKARLDSFYDANLGVVKLEQSVGQVF